MRRRHLPADRYTSRAGGETRMQHGEGGPGGRVDRASRLVYRVRITVADGRRVDEHRLERLVGTVGIAWIVGDPWRGEHEVPG